LESHLAFRSRVLEYIWAGLPIVATEGDVTSDLITRHQLGEVVPHGDVEAVAAALLRLLARPRELLAENFQQARGTLTWDQAAGPLIEFCRHPRRAADKTSLGEQLGHPYYMLDLARWRRLAEEREAAANWYEQHGLLLRLMKWLDKLRAGRERWASRI
jgi:glycosyltransferase involved in cell wall biosynthesis